MDARLIANITSLTLSETLGGGAFSFPKLVANKHLTLKLSLAQKIDGANELAKRVVHGLKASVGRLDARPESGTYQLMIGAGPEAPEKLTSDISYAATAAQLQEKLDAVASLPSEAKPVKVVGETNVKGELVAYRVRFKDGLARDIACVDNSLWPLSFVEVTTSEHDEGWIHLIKLTQALAAQTVDLNYATARNPTIERIQEGGGTDDASWNELQKLTIPPEFNVGSFQLRRGFKRTTPIGLPTSGDEIATALKGIADDGGEFIVTEQQDAVLIEFAGDSMKGRSQELLEVAIIEGPEPALSLTLDTDTAEMDVLMQRPDSNGEVKLPLEIELQLQDETDEEKLHPIAWRTELTFLRPLNLAGRNVAAMVNWNQPLTRRDTKPYGPNQFILGQRHAEFAIGDDVSAAYTLNHNLDAAAVGVIVRDNSDSGRIWRDEEYSVEFDGLNALTVTFADPVPADSLVVVVTTAKHQASFLSHEHEIGEVINLEARLAAIEEALSHLSNIAPQGGLTVDTTTETSEPVAEWTLPSFVDIYPTRYSLALPPKQADAQGQVQTQSVETPQNIAAITPAWLDSLGIKDGGLLPAVHRANVIELYSLSDFGSDYEGNVFVNRSGGDLKLPGKKGRGKDVLYADEFVAYKEGMWYRVTNAAGTKSYFPTQFDRTLFELAINSRELRYKKTLKVSFGFEVAVITNLIASLERFTNSPRLVTAQWKLVVEWGEYGEAELTEDDDQEEVRDTAGNLDHIWWHTEWPLLEHRFMLTSSPTTKEFGVEIICNAAGDISANKIIAKGKESCPEYWVPEPTEEDAEAGYTITAPTTRDFMLRARLVEFDTTDVWQPQGLVVLIGLNRAIGTNGPSDSTGKAQIK